MRTQEAIKTIVKKIAFSQAPQNEVQELINIAEKGNRKFSVNPAHNNIDKLLLFIEPEATAKIFRVDSLISYFLPLLNYPNMEFSSNVAKLLSTVSKDSKWFFICKIN